MSNMKIILSVGFGIVLFLNFLITQHEYCNPSCVNTRFQEKISHFLCMYEKMVAYWMISLIISGSIHHMCTNVFTVSDTITDKRRIYYRQLTKYPSKKVTLEISVSKLRLPHHRLDFYLFNGNFRPKRNCSYQKFGQLRNEDLHIPLASGRYRFVTSNKVSNTRSYLGKTTVQDFIPRNFGFSIGIVCDEKYSNRSLNKGLTFNISLYDATNVTECIQDGKHIAGCQNYCVHIIFPNMFGNQYSRGARKDYNQLDRLLRMVDPDYPQFSCYKHFHEFMCYVLTPRCDPQTKQMVPPCREACEDFLEGCMTHFQPILPEIGLLVGKIYQ